MCDCICFEGNLFTVSIIIDSDQTITAIITSWSSDSDVNDTLSSSDVEDFSTYFYRGSITVRYDSTINITTYSDVDDMFDRENDVLCYLYDRNSKQERIVAGLLFSIAYS